MVILAMRSGFGAASARAGNVIGGGDRALDRIVPDTIAALESGFCQATDLAEFVMQSCGLDYRTAYQIVGVANAQDVGQWMDLPDKARIGLAGVIYLDFERLGLERAAGA